MNENTGNRMKSIENATLDRNGRETKNGNNKQKNNIQISFITRGDDQQFAWFYIHSGSKNTQITPQTWTKLISSFPAELYLHQRWSFKGISQFVLA